MKLKATISIIVRVIGKHDVHDELHGQENIKGRERVSPIYTLFHTSRVIFNTTDLKGD